MPSRMASSAVLSILRQDPLQPPQTPNTHRVTHSNFLNNLSPLRKYEKLPLNQKAFAYVIHAFIMKPQVSWLHSLIAATVSPPIYSAQSLFLAIHPQFHYCHCVRWARGSIASKWECGAPLQCLFVLCCSLNCLC